MAHHSAHPRTITVTFRGLPVRRMIRGLRSGLRAFEGMAARHWPFAAYGALTIATAAYVIVQITRVTR